MKYAIVVAVLFVGLLTSQQNMYGDQPNGEPWSENGSMERFFHEPTERGYESLGKPAYLADEFDEHHERDYETEENFEESGEPWYVFWESLNESLIQ